MSVFVREALRLLEFYVNMHVFICVVLCLPLKDERKWNENGSIANLKYFSCGGTFNI